ncbi:MAG: phosphatase PAP2 family protein [Acidimicrobiales bacterium]|nr:phosphatase PAP2 family protein [Acidimicrobiales bacterium]
MNVDRWLDDRIGRLRGNPVADRIMYSASWFGDDGRGWIAASAVRSLRTPAPAHTFLRHLAWLGIESAVVNGPAKGAVRRERPAHDRAHPHKLRRPGNSSFPSGHAASAATMATLLSEDGLAPLWWAIALTVSASRVYVGVHHSSDVLGGLAIGTAIGLAARRIDLPLPVPGPGDR